MKTAPNHFHKAIQCDDIQVSMYQDWTKQFLKITTQIFNVLLASSSCAVTQKPSYVWARTILVVPSLVALVWGSLFYVACCSLSKNCCLMFPPILVVVLGVTVNPGPAPPPRETSTFQDLPKHLAQRSGRSRGTSNVKGHSWWKPWHDTAKSPGEVDLNLQPSNIQTELLCNEIFFNKLFSVYCGNLYINDNFYKGRK